jgi:large subunit ribosomal protein L6
MSRVGKNPISVPKDVKVNIDSANVRVEGKKGKLELPIPHGINVELKDERLTVTRISNAKQNRANHGTIRARLASMIIGVTEGHKKDLEIQGIGFRAQLQGKKLLMNLGFSHPVEYAVPDYVKATVATQTSITIEGADKVLVGQVAAKIRDMKRVEPYKGKGIRYVNENVRRKQGKSTTK